MTILDADAAVEIGPLRPATETAARERARLEATHGRSSAGAFAARVGLAVRYLGSAEAAASGLRYQPVVWSTIAVVAIAAFFPGRLAEVLPPSAELPPIAAAAPSTPPATGPAELPPIALPPISGEGFVPPLAVGPSLPPVSTPDLPPGTPDDSGALAVRGFGWAGRLSGTPLGTVNVPEGAMPVSARLGDVDKVTFVRLEGAGTSLVLTEHAEGAQEALGAAQVVACPITAGGWLEEPDQPLSSAPTWATDRCVPGTEADGAWTFDLSGFGDRTGERGFALVPAADAPPDFQIAFEGFN